MTDHQRFSLMTIWKFLTVIVAMQIVTLVSAHGQATYSGNQPNICVLNAVDWSNDIEQTVCIVGDESELDAWAITDDWAWEDYSNWPNGDPYVVGLGAEVQLWDNTNGLDFDTGIQDSGPYGSLVQQGNPMPNPSASGSVTPIFNATYVAYGLYSECNDPSGSFSDNCNWLGPYSSGLWVQVQLTGTPPTPTLSLTSSNTSSYYGQPITFTATIDNGPMGWPIQFFDGSQDIGAVTLYGNTVSFTTGALSAGTHSITANWLGNINYSAATSNVITQTVSEDIYSYTITPVNGTSGYAPNGDLLGYYDSVMGAWTSTYDALNRLIGGSLTHIVEGNSTYYCWIYDNFGNRTNQKTSNQAFQSQPDCQPYAGADLTNSWARYTLDGTGNTPDNGKNQISATFQTPGGYGYDGAGDVTSDANYQYLYDMDGHVCAVRPVYGGAWVQYLYDADGNRVAKGSIQPVWVNGQPTLSCNTAFNGFTVTNQYILGVNGEQVTELTLNGGNPTWAHTNAYAAGRLIATYDGAGLHFRFTDWLGTMRAQANASGVRELTCQSLPFGDTPASCVSATEQFFTGKERDSESGLDYFGARYYGSAIGRFMSPDKTFSDQHPDDPQSWNLYAYGRNTPLGGFDPNGEWWIFTSAVGKAEKKIDVIAKSNLANKQQQSFFIDLAGIPGLHFHSSFPEDAFNRLVTGHTSTNSQRVGNWHVWPGWGGAFVGLVAPIQIHNAEKIAAYAYKKNVPISSIGYSNGVAAQGELSRYIMNTLNTSMAYSLSVEPNTNLKSLIDIDNASTVSQLIRSDKDNAIGFWGGLGSASVKDEQSLSCSEDVFITHSPTHNWQINTNDAIQLNGGPLGP